MRLIVTIIILFISQIIYSQNWLVVDSTINQVNLKEYAYYYTDSLNNLNKNNFNSVEWSKHNKIPLFLPSGYGHWLQYNLFNNYSTNISKIIFIPYHLLHKIDVYIQTDSTIVKIAETGIKRSFKNKEKKVIGYSITINLKANSHSKVYIKYEHLYRPVRATSYLISEDRLEFIQYNSNSLMWFWRGVNAFALVISLLLFWFVRRKIFLYYFSINVGIGIFMFAHVGDYFLLFDIDATDISSSIDYVGAFLINMFFLLFANELTPIKKHNKKVWKFLYFLIYGMIPFVVVSFFPSVRQSSFTIYTHNYIMVVSGIVLSTQVYFFAKNIFIKEENAVALTVIYAIYVSTTFTDIILPNMALANDAPFVYRDFIFGSFIEAFTFMFMMGKQTLKVFKHRSELIEKQKRHQKEIIYTMVNSQEEERNRTGRELHDLVGANMAIIKQKIPVLDKDLSEIVNRTLDTVRTLSHGLVTPMVNNDEFIDEMKQMAHLCSTEQMEVHIYFHKWPQISDNEKTTHLYRIGQELLQNATKHSKAKNVYFQFIGQTNNILSIYYEDDGVGFDCRDIVNKGLGLKNIQNRVEIMGGTIVIESLGNNSGTTINIEVKNQ